MPSSDDLIFLSATEVVNLLVNEEVSPTELLDALETQIERVDGLVNALPTTCFERAREHARNLQTKRIEERGLLAGLPIPIKDLNLVSGVRTTFGSMVMADHVPDISEGLVERLETNGALIYAKSNTPEYGAGGNTFNDVFGPTRNPYDLDRSAGGSSGGAAAALASGTAWLAHGSDMAGSLRTPASFCGVTSLRPSPGLIVSSPSQLPFQVLGQSGPMARNVTDLALFTDAMVGPSASSGLSKPHYEPSFTAVAAAAERPQRIAFSPDLGITQTDSAVLAVCNAAMQTLERDGVAVELAHPDLSEAHRSFAVLRGLSFAMSLGALTAEEKNLLKPELAWNIAQGLTFTGEDIRNATLAQGRLFETAAKFLQDFDVLICPAAIVPPIPVKERYLGYQKGLPEHQYYEWLAIAYGVTITTLPALTIPAGLTADGLPIGIQLIGKAHGEHQLFKTARYIEQLLGCNDKPIEPRSLNA